MFTLMAGGWLFLNPFANGLTESDVKLQETMVLTASYCTIPNSVGNLQNTTWNLSYRPKMVRPDMAIFLVPC